MKIIPLDHPIIQGAGGCFAAGTFVQTFHGAVPIEQLKRGDKVASCEFENGKLRLREAEIHKVHSHEPFGIIRATFSDGTIFRITPNHWVWSATRQEYIQFCDLSIGDELLRSNGQIVTLKEQNFEEAVPVFNLTVDVYHNYFANGILVHNGGGGKSAGVGGAYNEVPDTGYSHAIAKVLDLVSEGELEGFSDRYGRTITTEADYAKAIYVNNTPIKAEDGSINQNGVTWAFTSGTPDQNHIQGFAKPRKLFTANLQITASPDVDYTDTINTVSMESITVVMRVNTLLKQYTEDSGGFKQGDVAGYSVTFNIDIDDTITNWNQNYTIEGKYSSPFQRSFTIPLPSGLTAPWTLTVSRVSADDPDLTVQSPLFVDYYALNDDEQLNYPNCALVATTADLKHFSGVPTRGFLMKGVKVKVPNNYTTGPRYTRAYTGVWNGTFTTAWTNNPAWLFYAAMTNPRWGLGKHFPEYRLNKWLLYEIGQYCDELVKTGFKSAVRLSGAFTQPGTTLNVEPVKDYIKDGEAITFRHNSGESVVTVNGVVVPGDTTITIDNHTINIPLTTTDADGDTVDNVGVTDGWEPRFTCSAYYQTHQEAWQAMTDLASTFRAMLLWAQGTVYPVQDRDKEVRHIFSNADVIDGMFNYSGTGLDQRHTRAEIRWNNPERNYQPDYAVYEDLEGMARYGENTVRIAAFACTSFGQAKRLGKYLVYTDLYESETVTFGTGLRGKDLLPGQVIKIQDNNRPQFGLGGGRIAAYNAGLKTITLDRSVTLAGGTTYYIWVFNPTDFKNLEEVTDSGDIADLFAQQVQREQVMTAAGATTTIELQNALTTSESVVGLSWAIQTAPEEALTSWRILAIDPSNPANVTITANRYDENKYTAVDTTEVVIPPRPKQFKESFTLEPPTWIGAADTDKFNLILIQEGGGPRKAYLEVKWNRSPSSFALGYRVYWRFGDEANDTWETWLERHSVFTTANTVKLPLDAFGDYQVVIAAEGPAGQGNWSSNISAVFNYSPTNTDFPEFDPGSVVGLSLYSSTWTTTPVYTFNERDAVIVWKHDHPFALETSGDITSNTGTGIPTIAHYRVEILKYSDDSLLRSVEVTERRFTYSLAMNTEDHGGVPNTQFKVKVYPVTIWGQEPGSTATTTLQNAAPTAPTLAILEDAETIRLTMSYGAPDEPPGDFQELIILQNTVDVSGSATELFRTTEPRFIEFTPDTGFRNDRYYWVKVKDVYQSTSASSNSVNGSPLGPSASVRLTANYGLVSYDETGSNPSPSGTITFTATATDVNNGYFKFTGDIDGGSEASFTDGATQYTDSATLTIPASYFSTPKVIRVGLADGDQNELAFDSITVGAVRQGEDGGGSYTVVVSNEGHALPMNYQGTVNYTGSGTTIEVWEDGVQLSAVLTTPTTGEFQVTVDTATNITAGSITTSGSPPKAVVADHSAVTADTAEIIYNINIENTTTVVKKQTFARVAQGPSGIVGSVWDFDSSTANSDPGNGDFRLNNATMALVSEIYIDDIDQFGNDMATYLSTWGDSDSTIKGYITLRDQDSLDTFWTGRIDAWTDGTGYSILDVTHYSSNGTFAGNVDIGFVRVGDKGTQGDQGNPGDDAVTHILTNPSHVVTADNDGTNYSLTNAGGTHQVFDGTTNVTTTASHSIFGSATKNGLTISVGASTGVYTLSGASWTSDSEVFTLRATYGAVNYDATYVIAKAKEGAQGDTGATGATGSAGADAYTVEISNATHRLPTLVSGEASYDNSGCTIRVYKGDTELNSVNTTPTTGEFYVSTIAGTYITPGSMTVTGNPAVIGDHSECLRATAYVDYTIQLEGVSVTVIKRQTITKDPKALPAAFGAYYGGSADITFTPNYLDTGIANAGELRVQGSFFNHPDATERVVEGNKHVFTPYEVAQNELGDFFIMWTDTAVATRWAGGSWGTSANFVVIVRDSGAWKAMDNNGALFSTTAPGGTASDVVVAAGFRYDSSFDGIEGFEAIIEKAGKRGPGIAFRGTYDAGTVYYQEDVRWDVVEYSGSYYVVDNISKNNTSTWGTPGVADWAAMTNFEMVATGLLLAEDATITRTLTMGSASADGLIQDYAHSQNSNTGWAIGYDYSTGNPIFEINKGFIRDSKANLADTTSGFYLGNDASNLGFNFGDANTFIKYDNSAGTLDLAIVGASSGAITVTNTTTKQKLTLDPTEVSIKNTDNTSGGSPRTEIGFESYYGGGFTARQEFIVRKSDDTQSASAVIAASEALTFYTSWIELTSSQYGTSRLDSETGLTLDGSPTTHEINLKDGATNYIRIYATADSGIINVFNDTDNLRVTTYTESGADAGTIDLYTATNAKGATVEADAGFKTNAIGFLLYGNTVDGNISAQVIDNANGGQIDVNTLTGSLRGRMSVDASARGYVNVYDENGYVSVALAANTDGGKINLSNDAGVDRIDAQVISDRGVIRTYQSDNSLLTGIHGDANGGIMSVYDGGNVRAQMQVDSGSRGLIRVYDNETKRLVDISAAGDGGLIAIYNDDATPAARGYFYTNVNSGRILLYDSVGGAVVDINANNINSLAKFYSTFIGAWTSSDTDIDALIPGTSAGGLIRGPDNGHLTFGVHANDGSDGIYFIADYDAGGTFDGYNTFLLGINQADGVYTDGFPFRCISGASDKVQMSSSGMEVHGESFVWRDGTTFGSGNTIVRLNQSGLRLYDNDSPYTELISIRQETTLGVQTDDLPIAVMSAIGGTPRAIMTSSGGSGVMGVYDSGGTLRAGFIGTSGAAQFGIHTATTDKSINGYITITDYAGNTRYLACITP